MKIIRLALLFCETERLPIWLALLATVLCLPSLWVGFQVDDHFHRAILLGHSELDASPFNLFNFMDGDPERTAFLMDTGLVPWWTLPELKLAFFRPISSFTHWLDYQLWPHAPAMMHAHNLLWHAALIVAATVFFRRFVNRGWIGGLAAALYAFDDTHGFPVGWIANRNMIIAAFFAVLTLILHDKWRREGWKPGMAMAPPCLLAGFLSAEFAAGALAYLAAYALFLEPGGWRKRAASLAPYPAVLVPWIVIHKGMGYGARGSGFYVDPTGEPFQFLAAVIERAPFLYQSQMAGFPAFIVMVLPAAAQTVYWLTAAAVIAVSAAFLAPLLRRDASARFLGFGMILALVPVCAVFPHDRVLFLTGLGAMGLIALYLHAVFAEKAFAQRRIARIPALALGGYLILAHAVVSPLYMPFASQSAITPSQWVEEPALAVPGGPGIGEETWMVVNAPLAPLASYIPVVRRNQGMPAPERVVPVASGLSALTVYRVNETTLRIEAENGLYSTIFDPLFRSGRFPMNPGNVVELGEARIEVLSMTGDGRPAAALFTFKRPLGDGKYRWLRWERGRYAPFDVPAVGESARLEAVNPLDTGSGGT